MIIHADAQALPLADGVAQCCVTSPPYWGLRDYQIPPSVWPDGWRGQFGQEPTPELYIEHLVGIFREVRRVLRDDGVLWLNLGDSYASAWATARRSEVGLGSLADGSRAGGQRPNRLSGALKEKDLVGIPWRAAFALQADGWYLRADVIWSKPNPMPESVRDRPTKAHEYVFLLSKRERYFWNASAVLEASNSNIRSVWPIATQPYSGAHFATMPEALAARCVRAATRTGDLVLDPFHGSGTVGRVAESLGRRWVGADLGYHDLAKDRVRVTRGLPFGA